MAAEFVSLGDFLRPPIASPLAVAPADVAMNAGSAATRAGAADDAAPNDESKGAVQRDVVHDETVQNESAVDGAMPSQFAVRRSYHIDEALREARLFRARLADAFDEASARLLRELAADVLARELRLAPCDIAALVQRVAARAPFVRVRVAPADIASVGGVPVVADPSLARGDAFVELAGGALDATLGVRLATVLEAFA